MKRRCEHSTFVQFSSHSLRVHTDTSVHLPPTAELTD
uniref:Uncharacterized protein n=1 Tax=Anguilla anguilla TaxID=7936 RepID=A0A0E9RGX7_ANGAN